MPHELRLMILGNDKVLRLFTWVFIDLVIRGIKVVTRGFELVTRGFEIVTCKVELVTRESEFVTRGFEITLSIWISTRAFKLSAYN